MVIELATVTIAAIIAQHIIENNGPKITKKFQEKFGGDNVKRALQSVLLNSVKNYGDTEKRKFLSKPLLEKDGVFNIPEVYKELAKLIEVNVSPNSKTIVKYWKESIEKRGIAEFKNEYGKKEYINPSTAIQTNFEHETNILLEHLDNQLKISETFGPVYITNNLEDINSNIEISNEQLYLISKTLVATYEFFTTKFYDLIKKLNVHTPISEYIKVHSSRILDKTVDFVGREYIEKNLDDFIANNEKGYYKILGEPGIGKTSFAANLVLKRGYIHHFNNRIENFCTTRGFLTNICAQLITKYSLDYEYFPDNMSENSNFLVKILEQVSNKLENDEKEIIVIDALDEVDAAEKSMTSNILFLPQQLPHGIYVITTMRDDSKIRIYTECESKFVIRHDSQENKDDIKKYICNTIDHFKKIQSFIRKSTQNKSQFVDSILAKSDGNFIYVRYVMTDLTHGVYPEGCMDSIPDGLAKYYTQHWDYMREIHKDSWNTVDLHILVALTVSIIPITVKQIQKFAQIQDEIVVLEMLDEWQQFLRTHNVNVDDSLIQEYSLYHYSFLEFLKNNKYVKITRDKIEQSMIDTMLPKDY